MQTTGLSHILTFFGICRILCRMSHNFISTFIEISHFDYWPLKFSTWPWNSFAVSACLLAASRYFYDDIWPYGASCRSRFRVTSSFETSMPDLRRNYFLLSASYLPYNLPPFPLADFHRLTTEGRKFLPQCFSLDSLDAYRHVNALRCTKS